MYDTLIELSEDEDIEIIEMSLPSKTKGLYADNVIAINKNIVTKAEKACILAEELGHYYTTAGDILDQSILMNRKQERKARAWSYKKLIGIIDLVNACKDGVRNRFELAEYLGVTEEFVEEAIDYYKETYGIFYEIDNYIIYFEPLGVFEKLDNNF